MTVRCTILLATLLPLGCTSVNRLHITRVSGDNAALYRQFQAFDGHSGSRLSYMQVLRRCRAADVILFGEQHNNAVCNQIEAQLLYDLLRDATPGALAMEFFETDTQAALDAYLDGRIDEAAFVEQTKRNRSYWLSHRPLIELCRAGRVPVIAANAPRRLLHAYRKSGVGFDKFRAALDPQDQRWIATRSELIEGPYRERFYKIMSSHPMPAPTTSAPASASAPTSQPVTRPAMSAPAAKPDTMLLAFRSQLLWDDTMAESLANYRERYPERRMMLVVGSFHVSRSGGTRVKFRRRRPDDRVVTIVYEAADGGNFKWDADQRDAAEIVIYGVTPPPEPARAPTAASAPATASAPTTASAPATRTSPPGD